MLQDGLPEFLRADSDHSGFPLVTNEKRARAEARADLERNLSDSKRVLDEIYGIMVEVKQAGREDTPEYQQILTTYRGLASRVNRAGEALRKADQAQASGAQAPPPAAPADLDGITPIRATLGPTGQPHVISRGADVTSLQKFLTATGFPCKETGQFDAQTRHALLSFQEQHGIKANGLVGAETRKCINGMLKGQAGK